MSEKTPRAYGTWNSSITARRMGQVGKLLDVAWDSDGETLVWLEQHNGITRLLMQPLNGDAPRLLHDDDMLIRGRLQYGGGEFTVRNGVAVFAGREGQLYRVPLTGGSARRITPGIGVCASPVISPDGGWVIYAYQQDGADGLALVDINGHEWPRKLVSETDFVMQPALHPHDLHLAYVTWNRPQMPWDGTELRLAVLQLDSLGMPYIEGATVVAGGDDIAVMQPEFSPDGKWLSYVSDENGWWGLYLYDLETGERRSLTQRDEAEYGTPTWLQGVRTYGWSHDSRALYAIRTQDGFSSLWRVDVATGERTPVQVDGDYEHYQQIAVSPTRDAVAVRAGSSVRTERLIVVDVAHNRTRIAARVSNENIAPAALSRAEAVSWTGEDGEMAHGFFYPPASEREMGIGLPPLIIYVHGGPTSQARPAYHAETQFFATRGFAVLQVNHRGSTGYGKAYKDKHRGAWGIYDVEDSASGAAFLAAQGRVDAGKLIIMGGSAGGYTVLQSLVDKPGFYAAGVCLYGISNQFTLVSDATFKFEAHYSDTLLGTLPEAAAVYRARSPLFHADKIVDPLILFQGEEDNVVPKSQSDDLDKVLTARGVPHEYYVYAGEGHGWRKPETVEAYLSATLRFLERYVVYR